MFKNLHIRTRLAVGFATALLLTAAALRLGLDEVATIAAQDRCLEQSAAAVFSPQEQSRRLVHAVTAFSVQAA